MGDLLQTLPFKQFLKEPEPDGKYEIIQQGNEPVIGFANGTPCGDYKDVVIFGDHTLSLYKPQHPFFVATDGVRIVKGQQDTDGYYLLSLLERYKPQSEGYKRYYSILADTNCITTYNTSEQEKIGVFFKLLDNLITLHQREFAFLCKEKSKKFRYIKNAWEQRKLGDVVDVRSGKDYKHLSEGNIPVYGTGGFMLSVNQALSYDEDAIGIGRKGTIDKPYILKAPFWTVDTLFYAIPREKVDLNFAFDVFQNIDWKKKDESTGVPSLSKTAINEIDVLVPQYDEQQPLGQFFNRIDNLITLHQRKPNFYTGGYYAE